MTFSNSLKQKAQPILDRQINHPFVRGLGDGTLDMDRFRYYMIQDTLYIVEYARAMTWTAALLPDVQDVIAMLDAAKETFRIESMLKEHYFEQFGLRTSDVMAAEMAPVCTAYVDYMIRYSRNGTVAEALAAIIPCGWIYVEIGLHFTGDKNLRDDHPYKSWLETYAVPEFRELVDWQFGLLDRAVDGLPDTNKTPIEDIFLKSCRYEWMFWDMSWQQEEWKP